MSRELEDLKLPILELNTAIEGLSLVGDSLGRNGGKMQDCLYFMANILRQLHRDLDEKYEAVVATEQDNASVPLHGV